MRRAGKYISKAKFNRMKALEMVKTRVSAETQTKSIVNGRTANQVSDQPRSRGLHGTRLVDLEYLVDQLNECVTCSSPIIMSNGTVFNVQDKGLATVLDVKCEICGMINRLHTSKKHNTPGNQKVYDINTRAAIGKFFVCFFIKINHLAFC